MENRREILRRKADEMCLGTLSAAASLNRKSALSEPSGTVSSLGKNFLRSKHNGKQRKLYRKNQKTEKAQAKRAAACNTPAPATSSAVPQRGFSYISTTSGSTTAH